MRAMTKAAFTIGLLTLLMVVPAMGAVNTSIKIEAGAESRGASTVNGSITIGADAVVTGDVSTVNGKIRVDSGASIEDADSVNGSVKIAANVRSKSLSTVNGAVKVGEAATVDGVIEVVNGAIRVETGSKVSRSISNVNGHIELRGAEVGGDVSTVMGDVDIVDGTVVRGDLIVEKPGGWGRNNNRMPRITIGPGSTVEGVITIEHEVELFISTTANVGGVTGVMSMDDADRFSGKKP
jgi:DUF4097 and DUF4098 domain-containing protein YvlB